MAGKQRERERRMMLQRLRAAAEGLPLPDGLTIRTILATEAAAPMRGQARDMQHDGLFGDGHKQIGLF